MIIRPKTFYSSSAASSIVLYQVSRESIVIDHFRNENWREKHGPEPGIIFLVGVNLREGRRLQYPYVVLGPDV